jgi:uncharacterized protein (AIM24 family)
LRYGRDLQHGRSDGPGFKNVVFGGEGLFDTIITGPGKVGLQTMTMPNIAKQLIPFLPSSGN